MKRFISGLIVGAIGVGIIGTGAVGVWDTISVLKNDIKIIVNGTEVNADNFLYNDTTYLPLRAVSSALGEVVEYDETENTAYIGERKDNSAMISKYTPPQELMDLSDSVFLYDGIYYISMWFLEYTYGTDVVKFDTDTSDFVFKLSSGTEKRIKCISINNCTLMPYDTFVDEIEPLLK